MTQLIKLVKVGRGWGLSTTYGTVVEIADVGVWPTAEQALRAAESAGYAVKGYAAGKGRLIAARGER